ncbi:MAG TPA: FHA domain-containing protein, partial [Chthonomonadaceae bacterium]|nr:FHA domain-containing protein [Chthonomonadaceae bacterium]
SESAPPDRSSAEPAGYAPPAEHAPHGTPGFVLPLPSQAPPVSTAAPQSLQFQPPTPAAPPLPAPEPPPLSAPEPAVSHQMQAPQPTAGRPAPTAGVQEPATVVLTPDMLSRVAAGARTRSHLVFRSGERSGETVALDAFADGSCAIGRSDIPENQVVIRDDPKVSRFQHAILTRDDSGRYTIRDNNSANKVFVNEQCLDSAPAALSSGDRIRLGLTELEFVTEPLA